MSDIGRPYDHAAYPHLGAPGGPWDAFDCPAARTISLMFGSRLSKTFFGFCCALFVADNDPAPMMHANADEKTCINAMERGYEMIRRQSDFRGMMAARHETDWKQTQYNFRQCKLYGAWSRSVATLADKDIKFGHAAEFDKWEQASTSKEADPEGLFTDRFKNYQSVRKIIFESTPTVRGTSRIERRLQAGTHCRLWVPCPRCFGYQTLDFGTEDSPGGLKFDRNAAGRSDPAIAFATARYQCRFCLESLFDHDRAWMVRRGVWVPRGCAVDGPVAIELSQSRMRPASIEDSPAWGGWKESPWIKGVPALDGVDHSYQLSSLYALSLAWGDIAKEWVTTYKKPQQRRNFINQWLAETWEPSRTKTTPELVAERLGTPRPAGLVPEWGRFLTVSVDRQGADGGFAVFVVIAHGDEERAAVVSYGTRAKLAEIWADICQAEFVHQDGGDPMRPAITVIDSGWDTKATYDFCNGRDFCFPVKGADSDLAGEPYKIVELGLGESKKTRTGATGQVLIHVATDFWETELDTRLNERLADEPLALGLCREAANDSEFLDQLLNAKLTDAIDRRGNERLLWVKKNENDPNDYRDAVRYGLCAGKAWITDHDGSIPLRLASKPIVAKPVEKLTEPQPRITRTLNFRRPKGERR